jgi:hypothetical protein
LRRNAISFFAWEALVGAAFGLKHGHACIAFPRTKMHMSIAKRTVFALWVAALVEGHSRHGYYCGSGFQRATSTVPLPYACSLPIRGR